MVSASPHRPHSLASWLACWLVFLVLTVSLQTWHGAYSNDLGGDPDEAAHAVTSLMVRDYLVHGLGQNPMRFAEAYYNRFPKVALGHYPPGFYLVAGVWLLPFPSINSLLVLHAALIATLATLIAWCASLLMPCGLASATGLLVCISAAIEKISVLVMSDVLVAIACLLAAISFASYLEKPRLWPSVAFGLAAAFAILTKGSGWLLALLPPLAIALKGRWRVLVKPTLWAAPVPVIVLALPWQLYSYKMTEGGMSGLTPAQHFQVAVPFYLDAGQDSFGWPVLLLLLGGLIWRLVQSLRGHRASPIEGCLWMLFVAGLVMALTVPAGTSSRYFIPITAPMILLALHTAWQAAGTVMKSPLAGWAAAAVVAVSLIIGLSHKTLVKISRGYHETIQHIAKTPGPVLVCSDSRGEGALVADAAFNPALNTSKDFNMLRATKELSTQDWVGRGYTLAFKDDVALLAHLKKRAVRWVLLDKSVTGTYHQPHFDQLENALMDRNSGWQVAENVPIVTGSNEQGSIRIFTPKP